MLSFLASWFADNLIYPLIMPGLITGVLAIVASWFIPPLLSQYKYIVLVIGIALVLFFTYEDGKYDASESINKAVAEQNAENARLEAKSTDISTAAVVQYQTKIQYVDRWKVVKTTTYVKAEADKACVISAETQQNIRMLINNSVNGLAPSEPVSGLVK